MGTVTGTLLASQSETLPPKIVIVPRRRFLPGASLPEGADDARIACPVQERRWTCELPVGSLDLELALGPYMPRYLWGVSVTRGLPSDVGGIHLVRGASVSGWVQRPDGQPAALAIAELRSPDGAPFSEANAADTGFVARAHAHGFFQIGPVPPAAYQIVARHGLHISHPSGIRTWSDREERLREPMILQPPSTLTVTMDPPLHPAGRPWQIGLVSVAGLRGRTVVRDEAVAASGRWTKQGLPTGSYRLLVKGPSGDVWHHKRLELHPGAGHVKLAFRLLHLAGTVSIGEEPLAARVTLASTGSRTTSDGQGAGVRISFQSDEEGRFVGPLPRIDDGTWAALIDSVDPRVRISLDSVPLERVGDGDARVTIRLSSGTIEGTVVDEAGAPITGMAVVSAHSLDDESSVGCAAQARVSEADRGRFRLRGLAVADYRVYAEGLDRQSDETTVRASEGASREGVTLVLKASVSLEGRVVGSDGSPVPGAEVVAWAAESPLRAVSPVRSDGEGRFRVPLPANTRDVMLRASAAGFARRVLRHDLRARSDVVVELENSGGTLVLQRLPVGDRDSGPGVYVAHGGGFEGLNSLVRWSALQGESPGPDGLRIPQMQAGAYRVCRAASNEYDKFITGTLGPGRCAEGYLPPGGELILMVPEV